MLNLRKFGSCLLSHVMGLCALKPEGLWVSLHCPVKADRVGGSPVVASRDLVQEGWPCFQAARVCSVGGEDRQKVPGLRWREDSWARGDP